MRRRAPGPNPGPGGKRAGGRRRRAVWHLGVGALLVVGLGTSSLMSGHVLHEHPHRLGQDVVCVACVTPLASAAPAPALAPPAQTLWAALPRAPAAAPAPPAPLTFSPKQSPPAPRPG